MDVLIGLRSPWPHAQVERLSVFRRDPPGACACVTRPRDVCSHTACDRSGVSPGSGHLQAEGAPPLQGGPVPAGQAGSAGLPCSERHPRPGGASAAPAGSHLSRTCAASTRDPLSPDTRLVGRAPRCQLGKGADECPLQGGFRAEMGCGISGDKPPMNPASQAKFLNKSK